MLRKILFISLLMLSSAHAAEGVVYYTELTCDPKRDVFEMRPKSIARAELAGRFDSVASALQTRDYAVFLNGKLVGEKVFKETCELQNEVSVEVDIDYGRKEKSINEQDYPNLYSIFKKYYRGSENSVLIFSQGDVAINDNGNLVAAISNLLTDPQYTAYISLTNNDLYLLYPQFNDLTKQRQIFSLSKLKQHPLLRKTIVTHY